MCLGPRRRIHPLASATRRRDRKVKKSASGTGSWNGPPGPGLGGLGRAGGCGDANWASARPPSAGFRKVRPIGWSLPQAVSISGPCSQAGLQCFRGDSNTFTPLATTGHRQEIVLILFDFPALGSNLAHTTRTDLNLYVAWNKENNRQTTKPQTTDGISSQNGKWPDGQFHWQFCN